MKVFLLIFIIVLIVVVAIWLSVKLIQKMEHSFTQHKKYGKAVIVGYDSDSSPNHILFYVTIPELDDNSRYLLEGRYNYKKINGQLSDCWPIFQIGDEVEVEYGEIYFGKMKAVKVMLREDQYTYRSDAKI